MQLRRLRLRNIRSYESADLELGPGTTLIAGDVGTGKTSLLYAVEMALFGFAEVEATYLVRHGAIHAEVAVTLEDEGHTYEIGRAFRRLTRRGKETFEVERLSYSEDGSRAAYSATELRQRVIDLFRFPDNPNPRAHSDLWRWAVYVPQERMREVLVQDPLERLETVRKALGLERYHTAAENAKEVAAEIRQILRIRKEESEHLLHWVTELSDRTAELDRLELRRIEVRELESHERARLAEAEVARAAGENALSALLGDVRELEGLEREDRRDDEGIRDAERRLVALRSELEQSGTAGLRAKELADRIHELEGDRGELERQRVGFEAERERVELRARQLALARADLATQERRAADARSAASRSQREVLDARTLSERAAEEGPARAPPEPTPRTLPAIDEAIAQARRAETAATEEHLRARTEFDELGSLLRAGVCPRCHQTVAPREFEIHREEAAARLERANGELEGARRSVVALDQERQSRERYERLLERFREAEKRRELARIQLSRTEDRARDAEEAAREAEAAVERQRAEVARLEAIASADSDWHARRASAERRRLDLDRRLETLRQERESADVALRRYKELENEVRRSVDEVAALQERKAARAERAGELRDRASGLARQREELERLRRAEQEARNEHVRATGALVALERDLAHVRERLSEAARGSQERAQLVAEARDLERKASWLSGPYHEALVRMEQRILAGAQAAFQRDLARFFRTLIDDPLLEARVDSTFLPSVLIDNAWTPADALSGGERTSLALAFRLALGRVVRTMGSLRLDTLILDEPTDGFSPEQVVRMGDLLEDLGLAQVILVSHEFELSSVADRVFETHKRDGISSLGGSRAPPPEEAERPEPARQGRRRPRAPGFASAEAGPRERPPIDTEPPRPVARPKGRHDRS